MFIQEQESVHGYSAKCHVDAEGLLKVTISCTVEVEIFRKRWKTDTLLLQTTNRNRNRMAYRIAALAMISSDFKVIHLLQGFSNAIFSYMTASDDTTSADIEHPAVPLQQMSFLLQVMSPSAKHIVV